MRETHHVNLSAGLDPGGDQFRFYNCSLPEQHDEQMLDSDVINVFTQFSARSQK
jgi:hypothetical protein